MISELFGTIFFILVSFLYFNWFNITYTHKSSVPHISSQLRSQTSRRTYHYSHYKKKQKNKKISDKKLAKLKKNNMELSIKLTHMTCLNDELKERIFKLKETIDNKKTKHNQKKKRFYFFGKRNSNKENIDSDDNDKITCIICMDNCIDTIIYPCKHFHCCYYCLQTINKCPTCNTKIIKKEVIYTKY
jgi:hypothetical protein